MSIRITGPPVLNDNFTAIFRHINNHNSKSNANYHKAVSGLGVTNNRFCHLHLSPLSIYTCFLLHYGAANAFIMWQQPGWCVCTVHTLGSVSIPQESRCLTRASSYLKKTNNQTSVMINTRHIGRGPLPNRTSLLWQRATASRMFCHVSCRH